MLHTSERRGSNFSSPSEKGKKFKMEVIDFLRETVGKRAFVFDESELLLGREVMGASAIWRPDIFIHRTAKPSGLSSASPASSVDLGHGEDKLESKTMELPFEANSWGLAECKKVNPGRSGGGTLERSMAQAYMELNDLRLGNADLKLFLFVSRLSEKGEIRRDYRRIFATIGVRLVNFEDNEDLERFKTDTLKELAHFD